MGAIEQLTAGRLASDEHGGNCMLVIALGVISTEIENDPGAYAYRREKSHPFESPL